MEGYFKRRLILTTVLTFSFSCMFPVQALAQDIYKPKPLSEYKPTGLGATKFPVVPHKETDCAACKEIVERYNNLVDQYNRINVKLERLYLAWELDDEALKNEKKIQQSLEAQPNSNSPEIQGKLAASKSREQTLKEKIEKEQGKIGSALARKDLLERRMWEAESELGECVKTCKKVSMKIGGKPKENGEFAYNYSANNLLAKVNGWGAVSLGDSHYSNRSGLLGLGEIGVTAPLGDRFGLQLDGFDGTMAHNNFQNIEGFAFWRSPTQGLVSPHVQYQQLGNVRETLYGLRGDAYIQNWTLTAEGGGVHTNLSGIGGTYYGQLNANWYAQPDLKFNAGYLRIQNNNAFQVGAEYQLGLTSWPGLTTFANLGAGSHSLSYGYLGLKYSFGENKPLIQRERTDTVAPTFTPVTFTPVIATRLVF